MPTDVIDSAASSTSTHTLLDLRGRNNRHPQDADGNLYIADSLNNRVRAVGARLQMIATVAGNGTANFSGDGGPATKPPSALRRREAVDRVTALHFDRHGTRVWRKAQGLLDSEHV